MMQLQDAPAGQPTQAWQFQIQDLLILTVVVAIEVAGAVQGSMVLFSIFVSVSIIALAVVWRRTLLRNVMLITILGVWLASLAATELTLAATTSSRGSGALQVGS